MLNQRLSPCSWHINCQLLRSCALVLCGLLATNTYATTSNMTVEPLSSVCELQSCTISMRFVDGGSIRNDGKMLMSFGLGASITLGDGGSYNMGESGALQNIDPQALFNGSPIAPSALLILASDGYLEFGTGGEINLGHGGNIHYAEQVSIVVSDATSVDIISDEGGEVGLHTGPANLQVKAENVVLIEDMSANIHITTQSIAPGAGKGLSFTHTTNQSTVTVDSSSFKLNDGSGYTVDIGTSQDIKISTQPCSSSTTNQAQLGNESSNIIDASTACLHTFQINSINIINSSGLNTAYFFIPSESLVELSPSPIPMPTATFTRW